MKISSESFFVPVPAHPVSILILFFILQVAAYLAVTLRKPQDIPA